MRFGFIGAGVVAQTFARLLLPSGREILLGNSRGPETLVDFVGNLVCVPLPAPRGDCARS